ncbi:MAG: pyridoxamine 5'-phosphate oxidase family protein [Proteobacteria bacterium]|nr:pyridoxamine 5'-phosphate oxidase family protein [Pseudomonadota bacterium]MBU1738179.1 pyridoxamine 5'-phosphate oxidase family protein [Pseudomonadota bacterium]
MRKANKEINDPAVIEGLLNECQVGRLGTVGQDGYPMIKPLNFAYAEGRIYFHSALAGEKIDHLDRDDRVCFEVDLPLALVRAVNQPCEAAYLYRSVIIKGRAHLVTDDAERGLAFRSLMAKYQPDGGFGDYLPEKLAITGIVRIEIESLTGKEDLGQGKIHEQLLAALARKDPLPVILKRGLDEK